MSTSSLESFAKSLAPDASDISEGKRIANRIKSILENPSFRRGSTEQYTIDRFYFAGSAEKGTAINSHYDFDCVLLLNVSQNPLKEEESAICKKYENAKKYFFEVCYIL